ncbi:MAG: tRNA 2-selenouridine(34) synthase MnmH [Gammaproteobacteria bacterium]
MTELPTTRDYRRLFLDDVPLLDVRAPVEFAQGAFPTAENVPIMDDEDRHTIGIRYKEAGQQAAIDLGAERVSGAVREQRIAAWLDFARRHPDGVLYCFRGGMRSQIAQDWLQQALGRSYLRVEGGYKALRRYLMDEIDNAAREIRPLILAGRTGSGKTRVIEQTRESIDLEGLANHRGSAFGPQARPQPPQIDFENALSIQMLKCRAQGRLEQLFEDESINIGARRIPRAFFDTMSRAPRILLEVPTEERIDITLHEYTVEALSDFQHLYGEQDGFEQWAAYLLNSMDRIRKRLGGTRHREIRTLVEQAIDLQRRSGDTSGHRASIARLLSDYYDPMYDYQIERSGQQPVFRGDREAVLDWLATNGYR